MILKILFLTAIASGSVSEGIRCDGYDYPEIETPYNIVDAKEASRMASKNRAGQKDIEAFKVAVNKAIGMGMLEVSVRLPARKLCPDIVRRYFENLGYKVKSDGEKCVNTGKGCYDWAYCTVRWAP